MLSEAILLYHKTDNGFVKKRKVVFPVKPFEKVFEFQKKVQKTKIIFSEDFGFFGGLKKFPFFFYASNSPLRNFCVFGKKSSKKPGLTTSGRNL